MQALQHDKNPIKKCKNAFFNNLIMVFDDSLEVKKCCKSVFIQAAKSKKSKSQNPWCQGLSIIKFEH